jgi:hypothetical protein
MPPLLTDWDTGVDPRTGSPIIRPSVSLFLTLLTTACGAIPLFLANHPLWVVYDDRLFRLEALRLPQMAIERSQPSASDDPLGRIRDVDGFCRVLRYSAAATASWMARMLLRRERGFARIIRVDGELLAGQITHRARQTGTRFFEIADRRRSPANGFFRERFRCETSSCNGRWWC